MSPGPEEYPTLLHFAARFGLEKLSWQLLECPGGEQACEIRNVCELTPAEMAEGAGHTKLANALRGYMQMTELTSMYSYLKIMSEGNNKVTGFPGAEYHHPRPLSETYMIPPSIPRPVMDNYQVPPAARPFNPLSSSPQDTELEGYMEMRPPGPKTRPALDQPLRPSLDFLTTVALPASDTSSDPRSPSPVLTTHSTRSTSRQHLDQISLNSSRNMKETASDSSSGSPADGSKVAVVADNIPLCMRPVSSLSLHSTCSSSSSGRMSTVSGCSGISLGDSGTHSDAEDRKQMITLPYDGARLGKGIANYEIPPAPRPIITQQGRRFSPPRYTPAPVKLTAATVPCTCIEERPPQPMPRPDVPETEFDDGNCYISVGGICGPSQEELTAHLLTNTQDGISETNPTNTEYLSLELETGTGVKTPCGSHKCSALRDYMNVNKRDQGTDGGRSTGLEGSKTGVDDVTPASPCPSDASDLPDYINVTIPAVTSAPPIPVRRHSTHNGCPLFPLSEFFLLYLWGALQPALTWTDLLQYPSGLTALETRNRSDYK
uniref:Uncharacterized protein n=2 Tax=Timema TaxID=61471 RepID=A0A7R9CSH8_TIMCR|nr:unnamed protein product [Timema cristinae]